MNTDFRTSYPNQLNLPSYQPFNFTSQTDQQSKNLIQDLKQRLNQISTQLNQIQETLSKPIQPPPPPPTNIYITQSPNSRQQPQQSQQSQASVTKRKVVRLFSSDPREGISQYKLPDYVVNGTSKCDKCFLADLVHGYHYGDNSDLCSECFDSTFVPEKTEWIEFSV